MTAKKAGSSDPGATSNRGGSGRAARWLLLVAVLVAAGAGLWLTVWDHVRQQVLARAEYRIEAANILVTPPPAWIHADVKSEVVRSGGLDSGLSLIDDAVTVRIAQAFALHPWIAKVTRVSKSHPANVLVAVVYRKPAAMVEVSGGLLPVDGEGVLLPSDDFSSAEAARYPRLSEIKTVPVGPQGSRWGDARVTGGARLAALLTEDWQTFHFERIVPIVPAAGVRSSDDILYDLLTQSGSRILWGHAPGSERPGDPRAADKLAVLRQHVARNGSLDGPDSKPQTLDLRSGRDRSSARRTAVAPSADDVSR
jgi:hypothetical protein